MCRKTRNWADGQTPATGREDYIKSLGYKFSTIGALTISMEDIQVPQEKYAILEEAEKKVNDYEKLLRRGLVSDEERYNFVIDIWTKATEDVTKSVMSDLDAKNNIAITH